MRPQPLEGFRPFIQRTNGIRVGAVEHLPAVAAHADQAHIAQYAQMLRYRGLLQPKLEYQIANRQLANCEVVEDLPPPRLGHSVEGVGSCGRSCHKKNIYSDMGICQAL